MASEKEKMLNEKLYNCINKELYAELCKCYSLTLKYNALEKEEREERTKILKELCPGIPDSVYLNGPIYFDFGTHIHFGENVYANSNLTILDCADVYIGNDVFMGTNVSIITPLHPLLKEERRKVIKDGVKVELSFAKRVHIGNDVWLCSDVKVLPGVTIGDGAVIGAGSVVTHDIPENVLAAGNPCKIIRPIDESDSVYKKKDLF